jgi:hypothetical protein
MGGGQPSPLLVPPFWYIFAIALEKIRRGLSGRSAAVSRRNLGRSNCALRRADSVGGTSLPEGETIVIIITIDSPILGGVIFIILFISTISSKTLVHLLYPILISNLGLVPGGLLVVLITPCS